MFKLTIAAIFKNESHILYEWLTHYFYHGAEHIYLINDYSKDDFENIINIFGDKITLFNNDLDPSSENRQPAIYEKFLRPILQDSVWMAIVDLDEFLYSPISRNIPDVLDIYNSYSSVTAWWRHFGSNDHKLQPHSVVESFTKGPAFSKTQEYSSYKTLFKSHDLVNFCIHSHSVNGDSIIVDQDIFVVNHYQNQSMEFYMKIKATRGDIHNWKLNGELIVRNMLRFSRNDINDISNEELYIQNRAIIEDVKTRKIDINNKEVTVVITSCNRPNLLYKTLKSFVLFNTYPISRTLIIEDSGNIGCNDSVTQEFPCLNITNIYNKSNIGQVESIDKVYSYVTTKYIFHCEEDWEFLQPGFIEKSLDILEQDCEQKIFTVWLRPHNHTNGHPINYSKHGDGFFEMSRNYIYIHEGIEYPYCGFTFNPGLRRTIDCLKFHPYTQTCKKLITKRNVEYVDEFSVNLTYGTAGYYAVILDDPSGHVKHIGNDYHIPRIWENATVIEETVTSKTINNTGLITNNPLPIEPLLPTLRTVKNGRFSLFR